MSAPASLLIAKTMFPETKRTKAVNKKYHWLNSCFCLSKKNTDLGF